MHVNRTPPHLPAIRSDFYARSRRPLGALYPLREKGEICFAVLFASVTQSRHPERVRSPDHDCDWGRESCRTWLAKSLIIGE
ncbi:hypothetical protein C7410_1496 [Paraburkholderia silvatlantica]|uniref:Uncharacterized protein n=1 Tax=Paraburkholderia silvatlantica TaxID=321895 RepID=A0A2V4TPT3_9BURK|nr:hypothetical protein C7410_1496 [Paraburkholderia silvatlantica]TDQ76052.1 hypothetical protein C7412_1395 [Paraburkholderia silvatlantica]